MASRNHEDPLSSLFRSTAPVDPTDVVEPTPLPASRGADVPDPTIRPIRPVERPAAAPPKPAGPDPATLAKILAKAAAAKAGAPAKPAKAPPPKPARAEPAPKAEAAPKEPASRIAGIAMAPPPAKKLSAAEALEAARAAEAAAAAKAAAAKAAPPPPPAPVAAAPAPVAAAPAPAPVAAAPAPAAPALDASAVSDAVQDIVAFALPNAAIYVPAAVLADDRATLRPLWKAHRARLVAKGDIERAAVAAAVVEALTARPVGALAAAQLHLDGGDFLGWFDLQSKSLIGVLPDPRGWGIKLD